MPARKRQHARDASRANTPDPIRVAIVGGGCAALTAAFELSRPEHGGRYAITVYERGWRLGGKGASGRGVHARIEEHGLHLWLGFYENAFRLMRECYSERHAALPDARFATWRDAFEPAPDVGVADRASADTSFWLAHFPPSPGTPGDGRSAHIYGVASYLRQCVRLVSALLRSAAARAEPAAQRSGNGGAPPAEPRDPAWSVDRVLAYARLATAAGLLEAAELLRTLSTRVFAGHRGPATAAGAELAQRVFTALGAFARRELDSIASADAELARLWQVIDIVLAVLRGALRSNLAVDPRGFDAINDVDWRVWLRTHGASERSLDSGFMRGIYDLVFAYEGGDPHRPRLAAGVALRGALRMFFTYRGALFWRMRAGMGDVVFAPLYQVLARRGVRFEFFHCLTNVHLAPERVGALPYVESLAFDVQAQLHDGRTYEPLIDVNGLPSWPAQPLYEQLNEGSGTRTLRVREDFDVVVLGVGIGALPALTQELRARIPRWRAMLEQVKTVQTQAFQLWLRVNTRTLGFPRPGANVSGYVTPFDTWADQSHLLAEECWPTPVESIAYFCSVLADDVHANGDPHAQVRGNAVRFLEHQVRALWPAAVDAAGHFRWALLAEPSASSAADDLAARPCETKFDSQYWTANVDASDRYVLSLPGSLRYRVSPLEMLVDNLTIAGDWTRTGLDSGCIESAVISGLLAAHAISHAPDLATIIGYDHP